MKIMEKGKNAPGCGFAHYCQGGEKMLVWKKDEHISSAAIKKPVAKDTNTMAVDKQASQSEEGGLPSVDPTEAVSKKK